ncbi:M48 family metallopeptidase [Enterovibrio nigricans]|uniref:Peptidase family M48 n=1 Tax=Enterovibrio nigricans DSM 22720 TaxID=1121868 RepID=A0A1T4UI02_9GAMM|nr:M48 family metallopeptidase [Enterovibrio nigricans]PKF50428.1 M48 family peptidase [Enterovibrio nigricans]SKA52375.1 Peptidase family M48 [Enterovibrio nigricans DSM 22720]
MTLSIVKLTAVTALITVLIGCSTSPTGRNQFIMVSGSEMATLGSQSFSELKKEEKISHDKRTNTYVQCVTNALLKVTPPQPDFESWEVVVFDSDQVNAFALPGGKIGVYTGLLNVAKTPDQLAAVVGHEIGHVMANHGGERVSSSVAANGALQIANIALGASGTANRDAIMAGLGLGVNVGVLLPFSRTHESESDLIGLQLMSDAEFNPEQSVELWKNMAKASEGAPPEFFSSHPSHSTRIADLQAAINRLPPSNNKAPNCVRP